MNKVRILNTAVVVSALGYFVDIFDLVLFSIARVPSLKAMGVPDDQLLPVGMQLLNMQMGGMLVGGVIWGIMGDKLGRVSVLFGSILLYSIANIANAFVSSTETYGILRLIAGIGLAGELGAAITLVSEVMPKETRGYGTAIVAGFGVSGAVFAALVVNNFSWSTAFIVGGVLGLMLLVLRFKMFESGMFSAVKATTVSRGNFISLFTNRQRFAKYARCILIGVPLWFVVGILVTFSPELCKLLGAEGPVSAASGIMYTYGGLVIGDLGSGLISQWLQSRKKVVAIALATTAALVVFFLSSTGGSPAFYYGLCFLLGCACGYWAIFVTIAAEQFGTNIRATVATTVPNFVRGSVVLLSFAVALAKEHVGMIHAVMGVGLVVIAIALLALWHLPESFHRDLDFIEPI